MVFLKILIGIVFLYVVVRPTFIYFTCRSVLHERLRMTNVRLDSAMWVYGGRSRRRGEYTGPIETILKFKGTHGNDSHQVTGYATVNRVDDTVTIEYINGGDILRKMQSQTPDLLAPGELTFEQRVVFETNQRLELLIGRPEEYLKSDVNGDGAVDAEEWAATRSRLEAEVRAELTAEARAYSTGAAGVSSSP